MINETQAIKIFTNMFEKTYRENLFLIADSLFRIPSSPAGEFEKYFLSKKDISLFNSLTGFLGFFSPLLEEKYVLNYNHYFVNHLKSWREFARLNKKFFTFTVIPGFSYIDKEGSKLPRSAQEFERRIKIILHLLSDQRYREIRIDTWNDFGENTYVEPSRKEGFSYLNVLRETLDLYASRVREL